MASATGPGYERAARRKSSSTPNPAHTGGDSADAPSSPATASVRVSHNTCRIVAANASGHLSASFGRSNTATVRVPASCMSAVLCAAPRVVSGRHSVSTPTTRSRRSADDTDAKPTSSSAKHTASAGRSNAKYAVPILVAVLLEGTSSVLSNVVEPEVTTSRPTRDARLALPKTASSRSRRTSARCDASSPASRSATSHRPSAHRRLSLVSSLSFDSSGRFAASPIRRMARAARSARVSPPDPDPEPDPESDPPGPGASRRREHRRRYASRRSRGRHAAMASARAPWPTSSKVSRAVGVAKTSREKCRAREAAAETRDATPEPRHAPAYACNA